VIVSGWDSKPEANAVGNILDPTNGGGRRRRAELRMEDAEQEAEHNRYKLIEEKSPVRNKQL
jgi:hypothetical protein